MAQTITGLSSKEAEFLATLASQNRPIFTSEEAREFWNTRKRTSEALSRLEQGGWLHRLERGKYLVVPLEAGVERRWSASALVIAPHLIQPAAVAYWSALHYWQLTEQIPRTVFVQSTARKRQSTMRILGITFRFVTVVQAKFFGIVQRTISGQPFYVTDLEKTLVDAADRPDLSGGILQLAQSLQEAQDLDWERFSDYLLSWPTTSPLKRIGYVAEALDLLVPKRGEILERWRSAIAPGVVPLEPGVTGDTGSIVTRWQLRINVAGPWRSERLL